MLDLLDEPERCLPKRIPKSDLVLSIGLPAGVSSILPLIVEKANAKALLVPISNPAWIPPGLQKQIEREIVELGAESAFPRPFCSLEETGSRYLDAFTKRFGKPRLEVDLEEGKIMKVEVKRGAPCGSTRFVAERIRGLNIRKAVHEAGFALHNYPCLASMQNDPMLGDTSMHIAGYIIKDATRRALSQASDNAQRRAKLLS